MVDDLLSARGIIVSYGRAAARINGRPIWSSNVAGTPGAERTLHEAAQRLGVHRHTNLPLAA